MRVTLICPGHERKSALVTLTRTDLDRASRWSARAVVDGVEHVTADHVTERDALVASAEWMRVTFGARATCLGSTVTIVGVSAVREQPA